MVDVVVALVLCVVMLRLRKFEDSNVVVFTPTHVQELVRVECSNRYQLKQFKDLLKLI